VAIARTTRNCPSGRRRCNTRTARAVPRGAARTTARDVRSTPAAGSCTVRALELDAGATAGSSRAATHTTSDRRRRLFGDPIRLGGDDRPHGRCTCLTRPRARRKCSHGRSRSSRQRRLGRHISLHRLRLRARGRIDEASSAVPFVRKRPVHHRDGRRQRRRPVPGPIDQRSAEAVDARSAAFARCALPRGGCGLGTRAPVTKRLWTRAR
jgi:hypothetical protein